MNKSELIDKIAAEAELSTAAAGRALNAALDAISASLQQGESVTLVGFGTFLVRQRGPREGRNVRTKETIQIPASKAAAFKPGKALKEALN